MSENLHGVRVSRVFDRSVVGGKVFETVTDKGMICRDGEGMMDYRLEQWINGPAGHHSALDGFMRHAATWAEPAFAALIMV